MVDGDGPSETPGSLKRSESTAKKAGIGGMFGGLLSKARPENKRRSTTLTDDEGVRGLRREDRKIKRSSKDVDADAPDADITMTGATTEEDQEARKAARRSRRADKEAVEKTANDARKAKDEERRDHRRKQEEEAEARIQEEKEARREARREQKAKEEQDRQAAEARETERLERRRARKAERESAAQEAEYVYPDRAERPGKSERRKSYMDAPLDEDPHTRKREERRAGRTSENVKSSRRRSVPIVDNRSRSRADAEGSKRKRRGWPLSGTDSWVKEHSDAPPPPEEPQPVDENAPLGDDGADEEARRALLRRARRRERGGNDDDVDERKRRRGSRRMDKDARSSDGSGDGRTARSRTGFYESSRAPSAQGGIFSRLRGRLGGA